jgi:hypothetical protein
MKSYTVFEVASGAIVGIRVSSRAIDEIALREGQDLIEGAFDALSYRIDPSTRQAVDYQPPRPDESHFWDGISRRWLVDPLVSQARARETQILQSIKGIDERLIRPMVELTINPSDAEALKIRDMLVQEKAKLRAELQGLTGK